MLTRSLFYYTGYDSGTARWARHLGPGVGQGREHPCLLSAPRSTLGTDFYSAAYKQCDLERVPLSAEGRAGGATWHSARERHPVVAGVLLPQATPALPHTLSPGPVLSCETAAGRRSFPQRCRICPVVPERGPWWHLK